MRTTIDKAGRLVIPKELRALAGLAPGVAVELIPDGAGIRLEPVAGRGLSQEGELLVIPAAGVALDDRVVEELRRAGQR